ncbi:uncharacterized protein LOC143298169 [Babylonia areolata]|uniref:uncharacterized protein LOC143298169 n=1 Tax=Babylonia areolata TaxID=304850 RepID=UPI003FD5751A
MARSLLLTLIVCLLPGFSQGQGEACDLTTLPSALLVQEGSANGTTLLTLPLQDSVELVRFKSPQPPPFIGFTQGTLYLNDSFRLDDQQELCDDFLNQGLQWKVFLRCKDQFQTRTITINVNLTDDFPPQFTTTFRSQIQEMTMVNSEVLLVHSNQVIDRDCGDNPQLGSSIFNIEAGNTDEAFALPNPRAGKIVVNRLLDYENGDTHFLLNLSVSDASRPERKSYTTVNVTVIDIDDSDPVFDHRHYVLHVQEEDTSSVGVWLSTEPPISVSDPDENVAVPDPLTISLYNSSDTSLVEVNSSTGQISLKRTFDRELLPSFFLVLKVQQTISAWRSSTATVTVVLDDVNDHPPLFTRPLYDVTVAEHSPAGTSVALVLATDADVGDNANFSYSLLSGEEVFSLAEQRLGQEVYGLLTVRNASLLDRELTPQINVTIGTEQLAGTPSVGCLQDNCQARVRVTLQDINDNNPVFDQASYVFHTNDSGAASSPGTVSAKDADSGPNGDVIYAISELGADRCDDVTIDARSGDISLAHYVTQACSVFVTACDNPVDPSQSRCSTVPVQILTDNTDEVVVLEAPLPPRSLLPVKAALERELGAVLGARVNIRHVSPASVANRSSVYISATNSSSQETLTSETLHTLIEGNREAITAVFERYLVVISPPEDKAEKEEEEEMFSPLIIAFIVIVAVLLVTVIAALVFLVKSRRRLKKQRRLLEKFSAVSPIYDNPDSSRPRNGAGTTNPGNNNNTTHDNTTTTSTTTANSNIHDNNTTSLAHISGSTVSGTTVAERGGRPDTLPHTADDDVSRDREVRAVTETDSGLPSDREAEVEQNGDRLSSQEVTPVTARKEAPLNGGAYLHGSPGHVATRQGTSGSQNSYNDATSRWPHDQEVREGAAPSLDPEKGGTFQHRVTHNTPLENRGDQHSQPTSRRVRSPTDAEDTDPTQASKPGKEPRPAVSPLNPSPSTHGVGEDDDGVPEEPEPDYAKKVRFSGGVAPAEDNGDGGRGEVKEGQTCGTGTADAGDRVAPPSTLPNSSGQSADSAATFWSEDEEITAF